MVIMSKRAKKQKQRPISYLNQDFKIRPVKSSDKWCRFKPIIDETYDHDAPYGYIITIPFIPHKKLPLEDMNGYIIRTKKHCGSFLLQVVKKDLLWSSPDYFINSYMAETKKKHRRKQHNSRVVHVVRS